MKKLLIVSFICGILTMPVPGISKPVKDFFYLIMPCPEGARVYVDGRILRPPYKIRFRKGMPRSFEIRTDEGIVYLGTIEPLATGDRTGKTFGYYTCITGEILNNIQGETRIIVKNYHGKPVARIKLKKALKPRLK